MTLSHSPLRMGMVGGGRDAFIGAVHRMAAALDGTASLAAGCFSSSAEKARSSGRELGVPDDRNYGSWQEMIDGERSLPRDRRIDFVSIVTPNDTHFAIARAFAAAGIHVICDKPLCHTSEQATELAELATRSGIVFCVTYNYSGYPMVKEARELVRRGELGTIRKVCVEYNQGWLAGKLEATGQKQADWRTDPSRSGIGGAIGDIGSHAEHLVSTITGLELESVCADLTSFVDGRRLDDDANVLLRFRGGAKGTLVASQICIGRENDLRISVHGSKGSLSWRQEDPNELILDLDSRARQTLKRGNSYLSPLARSAGRIPAGHPEAFLEAFANVYRNAAAAIRSAENGTVSSDERAEKFDYPGIRDGARGVRFIETVIRSAASDQKWTIVG